MPKTTHMYARKRLKVMSRNVPNWNRPSNQGFPRSDDLPHLVAFAEPRRNVLHAMGTEPYSTAQKRNRDLSDGVSCSGYVLGQERRTLFELAHDQRGHRRIDGTFLASVSEEMVDDGVGQQGRCRW